MLLLLSNKKNTAEAISMSHYAQYMENVTEWFVFLRYMLYMQQLDCLLEKIEKTLMKIEHGTCLKFVFTSVSLLR